MAKLKAIALYDYDAEAPDELTLKVGDVLADVKSVEEGWCQGSLNGKVGMFPDNFVKMEEEAATPGPTKTKKETDRFMKVTFAYEPQNPDELKLNVNDIVKIEKEEEEGWAQGLLNGKKGVFPTNFCAPYTPESAAKHTEENKEPEAKPENTQKASKKVQGVGFGNIFGDGPITLKNKKVGADTHTTQEKSSAKKPQEDQKIQVSGGKEKASEKPAQASVRKKKSKQPVEKYRVTFDYEAQTSDELTLVVGDVVTVLSKNCEDDGWWEGEIVKAGKKQHGVFPDNFVTLLSPEEVDSPEQSTAKEQATEPASDAKVKITETDAPPVKEEKSNTDAELKSNDSIKKAAPPMPSAVSSKPKVEEAPAASELDAITDAAASEDQLIHIRRVSGPKNRRKPDSTNRRERAKEAEEAAATAAAAVDNEPESPKHEHEVSSPPVAPKKEARGIAVMPSMNPTADAGEKPAWMKNLKGRSSHKKEPVVSPTKPDEGANETPDWLSNLRKRPPSTNQQKKSTSPVVPNKPGPGVTPPKPSHANKPAPSLAASFASDESKEKPSQAKTPIKEHDSKANAVEVDAKAEPKKTPIRPPVPTPAVAEVPRKPPAAKPKPPPSKTKPSLPSSKPVSNSSVEELKEEIKSLRELMSNFRAESMKEISRLSQELEEEKKHRVSLQNEVANLSSRI